MAAFVFRELLIDIAAFREALATGVDDCYVPGWSSSGLAPAGDAPHDRRMALDVGGSTAAQGHR